MRELTLSRPITSARNTGAAARSAGAGPFTADVLSGAEALRSISDQWRALAEIGGKATLFQAPEILAVWARHFAGRDDFLVVVARQRGRIALIWPMGVRRCGPLRILTGAGAPIGQYDEILIDPEVDSKAAFRAARSSLLKATRADAIGLERVREGGPLWSVLAHEFSHVETSEAAPFADLSSGFDVFKATLKKRVIDQQRRRVRRFERAGDLTFEVAQDPAQAQVWVGEALALKREWLRSTGRISRAFADARTATCLSDFASALARPPCMVGMVVFRLALDGRTAALEMCFRHGDTLHFYIGAFAPEFSSFGPGNILTERILRWCESNRVSRYDMLSPRSRSKSEWQSGEVTVFDFAIPVTTAGRIYGSFVQDRISPLLRTAFYRLPPKLRSSVAGLILKI